MPELRRQDLQFERSIRSSFEKQSLMTTIGAELVSMAIGEIEIQLPFREDLLQQHGYLHGGIIAAVTDTACGYAARSLMPANSTVLTVEYKVNFLAPAAGDFLLARGSVIRAGRNLTVCRGEAWAVVDGSEKKVATMLATMMRIEDRPLVDE